MQASEQLLEDLRETARRIHVHVVRIAAVTEGLFYLAFASGALLAAVPEEQRRFELGRAVLLREGDAATLIGLGATAGDALRAGEMLGSQGVQVRLLNMHTVKPLDRGAVGAWKVRGWGLPKE